MSVPATLSPDPKSLDPITKATGLGAFVIGGVSQGGGAQWGQGINESFVQGLYQLSPLNPLNMLEVLGEALAKLPLEALQQFQALFPDLSGVNWTDAESVINGILSQVVPKPIMQSITDFENWVTTTFQPLLTLVNAMLGPFGSLLGGTGSGADLITSGLTNFLNIFNGSTSLGGASSVFSALFGNVGTLGTALNQIGDLFNGNLFVTPINTAVQMVKDWLGSGLGASGAPALPAQFTSLMNTFFGALQQGGTPSGLSFPDLMTALQQALTAIPSLNVVGIGGPQDIGSSVQTTWDQWIGGLVGQAGTGTSLADLFNIGKLISSKASQGSNAWSVLGIRTNTPIDGGTLSTSRSNFPLSKIALQATPPTIAVTQAATAIDFHRIEESSPLGAVRWLGSGNTNITDFRVNIWKMDTTTGDLSLVHNSTNQVGLLAPANSIPQRHTYVLPTPLAVKAGEVYGRELVPFGTGTHNVAGSSHWVPHDTATFPRNYSATRNATGTGTPPATIPAASVVYSNNATFSEIAIDAGSGIDVHDPLPVLINTVGTQTVPIPSWANFVDVIPLGAGGGGHQGGTWGVSGGGGFWGSWGDGTWQRGVDFTGAQSVTVTVGAGGSANSGNGQASSASIPGHSVTGAGGLGNQNYAAAGSGSGGGSAGTHDYNGGHYQGGGQQLTFGADGAAPGGGGAGGNYVSFQNGGKGAPGAVWLVFRQS